ncbi:MAG: DNA recombination protein RmuC [bacterium]
MGSTLVLLIAIVAIAVGAAIGAMLALRGAADRARSTRETAEAIAQEVLRARDTERNADIDRALERMKAEFGSVALATIQQANEALVTVARERLGASLTEGAKEIEGKKGLIDKSLTQISDDVSKELAKLAETVKLLEKDREGKFEALATQLASTNTATRDLAQTAASLREALSSSKARGAWGERMAEDVLRLAGFVEPTNYVKQKTLEGSAQRPDFTFLLPNGLRLNMDVKFPLDNYMRYLDATSDGDRERFRTEFLRDARKAVKQVTTRDYIDPESNTVDCVLLFIPNEQVYGLINEWDRTLMDEAVRNRVVLCSPFTLYAVLALVRQTADNFNMERRSKEILTLLGDFEKQWSKFKEQMEKMGRRIDDAQKEYATLVTTRTRALDRPLDKIDALRRREIDGDGDALGLVDARDKRAEAVDASYEEDA